jgi:uncharacterized phage protein (TIGR01671 family)
MIDFGRKAMSREIKFRAYIKTDKVMLDVVEVSWYSKNVRCVVGGMMICPVTGATQSDFDFPLYEMDDVVLLEFTGLKDKNGVEIWESDVFTCNDFEGYKAVVSFSHGAFGYIDKYGDFEHLWDDEDTGVSDLEILGNLHEHPELLEE